MRADQLAPLMERFRLEEPLASLAVEAGDSDVALESFADVLAQLARRGVRAGEIDWAERWKEMVRSNRARASVAEADPWAKRAARYARMSRERPQELLLAALGPLLSADDVVADVGAGSGRHVIELAPRVRRVIAIEPSPAMRGHLEQRCQEERLHNVSIRSEPWPHPLAEEVDLAFSAHVLYGVEDPLPFIRAMNAARRRAVLYLSPRPPQTAVDVLWAEIHGWSRPRPPGALEAVALLWQLGLRAEVEAVAGTERPMLFRDEGDDLIELCHRLAIAPDADGTARVKAALARCSARGLDGSYAVGRIGPHLLIHWSTR
jgi:SAM-dependent methyltransferase